MGLHRSLEEARHDPEAMERLFRSLEAPEEIDAFKRDVQRLHDACPRDVLLSAWSHRLGEASDEPTEPLNWKAVLAWALPCGILCGTLAHPFFTLGADMPLAILVGGPVCALFVAGFLGSAASAARPRLLLAGAVLLALTLWAGWFGSSPTGQTFSELAVPHLLLLAWGTVGFGLVGHPVAHGERFSFLFRSAEVFVTGGLYSGVTLAFLGVVVGMFALIDVAFSLASRQVVFTAFLGLLPVVVISAAYNPSRPPSEQAAYGGISRILVRLARLLLPLGLCVLLVYLALIPARASAPFEKRSVLIVYNAMIFAIGILLLGSTPERESNQVVGRPLWHRRVVSLTAGACALLGLYAMAAVSWRTAAYGWTMNRLAVLGWNTINIALLVLLVVRLARCSRDEWAAAARSTFVSGIRPYLAWSVLVLIVSPLLFR